jgi:hypothetical protein
MLPQIRQIHRLDVLPQTLHSFSGDSVEEWEKASFWVYRHTGQPLPRHFSRQAQWKTCWQRIVSRPVVSSMRSRQTGQVGSSTKEGVGGGMGFVVSGEEAVTLEGSGAVGWLVGAGVKGSLVRSG